MRKTYLLLFLLALAFAGCGRRMMTPIEFSNDLTAIYQPNENYEFGNAHKRLLRYLKRHPEAMHMPFYHDYIGAVDSPDGMVRVYNLDAEVAMHCHEHHVVCQWYDGHRVRCRMLDLGGSAVGEILSVSWEDEVRHLLLVGSPAGDGPELDYPYCLLPDGTPVEMDDAPLWKASTEVGPTTIHSQLVDFYNRDSRFDEMRGYLLLPLPVVVGGDTLLSEGFRRYYWDGTRLVRDKDLPVEILESEELVVCISINPDWSYSYRCWSAGRMTEDPDLVIPTGRKEAFLGEDDWYPYAEIENSEWHASELRYVFENEGYRYEIRVSSERDGSRAGLTVTAPSGNVVRQTSLYRPDPDRE